jgi:hypothetical protein
MKSTKSTAQNTAWRWVQRVVCVLGVSTLVAGGGLRQDEVDCEDAIAYLQGCCPDFTGSTVACVHDEGCGEVTDTALSIAESQCITGDTCEQIVSAGICERVKNLASPTQDDVNDTSTSHPPVCP